MIRTKYIKCIGCGAEVTDIEGPTFRYPESSSPGCWQIFGEIRAREMNSPAPDGYNQFSTDAYAVQHPGSVTPQTIQSVNVHLISLCSYFEFNFPYDKIPEIMNKAIEMYKGQFEWLTPPKTFGKITAPDILKAGTDEEFHKLLQNWAKSSYQAWSLYHERINNYINSIIKK